MHKKSPWIKLAAVLLVLALAFIACDLPTGGDQPPPSEGEPGQVEPAPEEPIEAPSEPEPTKEPVVPEAPDEPPAPEALAEPPAPEAPAEPPAPEAPAEPPAPAPEQPPPDSGGETTSEGDLLKIFIVLVIILLILGVIMMIVGALGGGSKSQAPAAEAPPPPQSVEDHLNAATPKAAELYQRFAELVQTFGQVSIQPTQTRIDFRVRAIFASVEFREDSLLALLLRITMLSSMPGCKRLITWARAAFKPAYGLKALAFRRSFHLKFVILNGAQVHPLHRRGVKNPLDPSWRRSQGCFGSVLLRLSMAIL